MPLKAEVLSSKLTDCTYIISLDFRLLSPVTQAQGGEEEINSHNTQFKTAKPILKHNNSLKMKLIFQIKLLFLRDSGSESARTIEPLLSSTECLVV